MQAGTQQQVSHKPGMDLIGLPAQQELTMLRQVQPSAVSNATNITIGTVLLQPAKLKQKPPTAQDFRQTLYGTAFQK